MRRLIMFFIIVIAATACNKPQDIVFGPTPLKQISEQGDQFRRLQEEDRTLLAGYLAISEIGKVFGAPVKPATGRTVGEVLIDARAWRDKIKATEIEEKKQEAESKALLAEVMEERKAVANKITLSAVVAIISTEVRPKNYDMGRYEETLSVKFAIENKSNKPIRQLKGRAVFKDATGDDIGMLYVDFSETVAAKKSKTTTYLWKINPYINGPTEKIAHREFSSMKVAFEPEAIAFGDGEIIKWE